MDCQHNVVIHFGIEQMPLFIIDAHSFWFDCEKVNGWRTAIVSFVVFLSKCRDDSFLLLIDFLEEMLGKFPFFLEKCGG